MPEEEALKIPEVGKREVGSLNCTHSLVAKEPHADVRFLDHWYIVGPVAYR